MTLGALTFLSPWLLLALASLPLIYWLLRTVPPRPKQIAFPPTRILARLENREKTPAKTPWWLLLLRLVAAALVILALSDPVYDPTRQTRMRGDGPVMVVVDNSWAAASRWNKRMAMIERLINEAEALNRPVMLVPTAPAAKASQLRITAPNEARETARALQPQPYAPQYESVLKDLNDALKTVRDTDFSIVWLNDGIDHDGKAASFAQDMAKMAGASQFVAVNETTGSEALGVAAGLGDEGNLVATVLRASGAPRRGVMQALSSRGERLAESPFQFNAGERSATAGFELPLEIRNQVARVEIANERSAGAVSLLDGRSHWQRVGLISGSDQEQAQPLLSPLYYVEKALRPFAEIVRSKDANLAAGLDDLLDQNATVIVLADIGTLSGEVATRVADWIKKGGVLIRFAGPRLEKGGDELLPVPLRLGGRALGGALSWSTPQPLGKFETGSLFAGLEIPGDVLIRRQVLADPARLPEEGKIWTRLKDGTPLVTARPSGQGQIVLFHVTANTDWSNLPISGLFVEMLRRISSLGTLSATAGDPDSKSASNNGGTQGPSHALAPIEVLDGFGTLTAPSPEAEAVDAAEIAKISPSIEHPAGYYGAPGSPRALNVLGPKSSLSPIDIGDIDAEARSYENIAAMPLKPWLLAAALVLLFADIIAIIILQTGGLRFGGTHRGARAKTLAVIALIAVPLAVVFTVADARAQDRKNPASAGAPPPTNEATGQKATRDVTFGYVLTGDAETDTVSRLGLEGLGRVLAVRTAVEPGEPIGVDIINDEIAFFPVLYWPVLPDAEPLPQATLAKIDAYMKQGGMIIFDTRDYGAGQPTGVALAGEGGTALQRLLGELDLPRLEPVPEDHVLTKAFYLLQTFPGRWDGGQLWVESEGRAAGADPNKARRSDGVTSILITSNDLASAWALDERGRGLYATVPGGDEQREMAFRTGVNIVMHALTGNYKADQVHVPSLLERLGQ